MPAADTRSRPWRRRARAATFSVALVGAGALLHAACERMTPKSEAAPGRSENDQLVLAKIDDTIITVGDFQNRINQQSQYVRARYTSLERKREFLDNLVRFEVLAREAQRRGLDKDDEVVRTMKQVMIQKLMKDEFDSAVKPSDVSDEDCRKYFDAHPEEFNKPAEVRVADVVVRDAAAAKKVLADPRIKGVEPAGFRELVALYSTDAATRDRGGDLRYFDAQTRELPAEVVKAAFALASLGDVSEPVRAGGVLHILKLTGKRKELVRPFDEVKEQIRNRLFRDRRTQSMEDFVKKLREKAKVEVHEERLAKVRIDSGPGDSASLVPPAGPAFHPGAPGAPQATPATPGVPPGVNSITPPTTVNPLAPPAPTGQPAAP